MKILKMLTNNLSYEKAPNNFLSCKGFDTLYEKLLH